MSNATKEFERRMAEAIDYYYNHDYSYSEAARAAGLKNHQTLSNRIQGKCDSVTKLGGHNRILTPA